MKSITINGVKVRSARQNKSVNAFIIVCGVILALYALILLAMLLWAVMTSLKDNFLDFYTNKLGFPQQWLFSNYSTAFEQFQTKVTPFNGAPYWVSFWDMLANSLLYAIGCSFFSTLIPCLTGYAMAKYRFKFSDILYAIVIITMALPIVGNLASEIKIARALGLYDTIWGMWIMSANFAGQYTLVFYATFRSIPNGYMEAAELDGASEFNIMVRIMLPLAAKTFGAIMLIKFIAYWNEYEAAMIYLKTHPTIAYGLYAFNGDTVKGMNGVPMKLTGCMILVVPIMILFVIFQNKLMGNVSMGGLKE